MVCNIKNVEEKLDVKIWFEEKKLDSCLGLIVLIKEDLLDS
jgi:hypothetical protein